MIDKFSRGFINSVYDFNDFTINELLCKLAQKMDEVIAQSNESFNYLDWLKGQGLSDEVINILLAWKEDGTFNTIINEHIFNELNNTINKLNTQLINIVKRNDNNELNDFFNKIENNTKVKLKKSSYEVNDVLILDNKHNVEIDLNDATLKQNKHGNGV